MRSRTLTIFLSIILFFVIVFSVLLVGRSSVLEYANGYELKFDGVDDNSLIPSSVSMDSIGTKNFTISYWIKTESYTSQRDFFWKCSGSIILVREYYGQILVQLYDGVHASVFGYSDLINDGNYHLINHLIYTDGVKANIVTYQDNVFYHDSLEKDLNFINNTSDSYLSIGIYSGGYFNGTFDNFSIFNRILSLTDIEEMFDNGLSNSTITNLNDLVCYYNFDEGSGVIAIDLSGNENNMTLINNPVYIENYEYSSGVALSPFDSPFFLPLVLFTLLIISVCIQKIFRGIRL